MPIYEYSCTDCGERFEVLHRGDGNEAKCPSCGSTGVSRLLSTFAAHAAFKMPSCKGAAPCCSESRCRSGQCRLADG